MKYSPLFKDKIGCNNESDVFLYLINSLNDSIRYWDYFVNWSKVLGNIKDLEIDLNILNYLIGKEDIEEHFYHLLRKYPQIIRLIPILLACRDSDFKILTDLAEEKLIYEEFSFKDTKELSDVEISKVIKFSRETGLFFIRFIIMQILHLLSVQKLLPLHFATSMPSIIQRLTDGIVFAITFVKIHIINRRFIMKKVQLIIMVVLWVVLIFAADSFAQRGRSWQDNSGWDSSNQSSSGRIYNPATVETVDGTVVTVDNITQGGGMFYGIHLVVRTQNEDLSVHLGPAWYLDDKGVQFAPNDIVTVTGSRVTLDGQPALIASEVKKGDAVVKLRDQNGFPLWSGRRGSGPKGGRCYWQ
jgi:hypothetical protein